MALQIRVMAGAAVLLGLLQSGSAIQVQQVPPGAATPAPTARPTQRPSQAPTARPSQEPTPAPTLEPGKPCPCLVDACFSAYDMDDNGCLSQAECDLQIPLGTNCSLITWDANQDGCINQTTEWPNIFAMTGGEVCPVQSVEPPPQCKPGYFLAGNPISCEQCLEGETRRRRSLACTPCPHNTFDAGDRDDCIDSTSTYTQADIPANSDMIPVVNCGGLNAGDSISVQGPPADPTTGGTQDKHNTNVSSKTMNAQGGCDAVMDAPSANVIPKFSEVVLTCTSTDGTELSRKYTGDNPPVCSCGDTNCDNLNMCHVAPNGTGTCIPAGPYPDIPTPAPTVGATGDPHLVNLQGEHFDINHAGEFALLRFPQVLEKPAEFQLQASIRPEAGKPCTTYITQVEFSGTWFGGKSLQVRSYLTARSNDTAADFLGARIVEGDGESAWQPIEMFELDSPTISTPDSSFEVSVTKSEWFPKKHHFVEGAPSVAGMFTIDIRNKKSKVASAKVIVRQDLPEQEHLNLAVRKLSSLGRVDVGGLLGFDDHPDSLEYVSAECNHHRATTQRRVESQEDARGYYYTPAWKERWDRIRHKSKDNEASASLLKGQDYSAEENMMCKCSSDPTGFAMEGVLVEEADANYILAQATW